MFTLQPMDAQYYRSQTRRSTLIICALLAALCFLMASASIALFGSEEGSNFRWNLAGVIVGVLLTIGIARYYLWDQPWMAPAAYGFRLKRNLMKVTNILHQVEAGAAANDPVAMRVLRFYHLGLLQMHTLEDNSTGISDMVGKIDLHRAQMLEQGLDPEQNSLDPAWLDEISSRWGK